MHFHVKYWHESALSLNKFKQWKLIQDTIILKTRNMNVKKFKIENPVANYANAKNSELH